ncbi:MFS general substrate transporter [Meredithblackwellia eburnea MCA 4105]
MDTKESSITHHDYKPEVDHLSDTSPDGHIPTSMKQPSRVFTPQEESKLYRKIDLRIMPILALLYLLSFMDPGNIGNARLSNLEKDLHMNPKGNKYNIALTMYFVSYCLFEVPSNIMLKKLRPSIWLASITVLWGVVMTLMGVAQNFGGLVAARVALGIAEAGLFPGVTLYLTFWYPRHMCQTRIAIFFGAATLAGAFSGLLAYGISFMNGVGGYSAWRWIFILEGIATVLAGTLAFWAISDFPDTATFLTEEEREWVVWRKFQDSGKAGEAEGISAKYIKQAFMDPHVWLSVLYYFGVVTPLYGVALFAPTIINSFGKFSRPQVQLLTLPVYVAACIWVIVSSIWSDKKKSRFFIVYIDLLLCLVGFVINITPTPMGVKYFGLILAAMGAYGGLPAVVTFNANNLAGQVKRGVGMAIQIGIGNFGGIVASNVYLSRESPHYFTGHGVEIGFVCIGLITAPIYAMILKNKNKKKLEWQELQASLPPAERKVFTVQELHDLGDRAPDFMYTI